MNILCLLRLHKWPHTWYLHPRKDLDPNGDYKVCERCGLIKQEFWGAGPLWFQLSPERVEYVGYLQTSEKTEEAET